MLAQLCDACDLMRAAPAFRSFCGGFTLVLVLCMYRQAQAARLKEDYILAMMTLQLIRVAPYYLEVGTLLACCSVPEHAQPERCFVPDSDCVMSGLDRGWEQAHSA